MAAVNGAILQSVLSPVLIANSEKCAGHWMYFSISLEKISLA
jgi:hypothetical protein